MGVPAEVIADAFGLNTQQNELTVPAGSLAVCKNMEITRDGIVEVARGFEDFSSNLPDFAPKQLLSIGGTAYLNLDGGLWYYSTADARWYRKAGAAIGTLYTIGGMWVDSSDSTAYVTDTTNHAVFKISLTTGLVSLLAGKVGTSGTTSGTGSAARFNGPTGIWGDGTNLYVADSGNFSIRKIVIATGAVTDFAGLSGTALHTDATGTSARFQSPTGIWGDGTNLYVTESGHGYVRKIVISSAVTTTLTSGLTSPVSVWVAAGGTTIYVTTNLGQNMRTINASTGVDSAFASGMTGNAGAGVTMSSDGTYFWVPTYDNLVIDRVTIATGAVSAGYFGSTLLGMAYVTTAYAVSNKLYVAGRSNLGGAFSVLYPATSKIYSLVANSASAVQSSAGISTSFVRGPDADSTERRIRAAAQNGNVYFTTNGGMLKSESASADIKPAGLPRALDLILSLSSAGTPVLLANGNRRGYRGCWGIRDANNNLLTGPPSSRFDISNGAGATRDVSVKVYLPPEITTDHFFMLFATAQTASAIDPGDDQRQVYEVHPTSTDVTNGYLTIVDITPDAFRGTDLYTNANEEGIAYANFRPPLARDVCYYRRRMLYANITEPHQLEFQMLGTSGMTTQTITIGGITFTAGTAEDATTGTFQVFKTGGGGYTDKGTQSLNVEYTAKSLCYVINQYAASTGFRAYYESGVDDSPGLFLLEEIGVGGSAFVATCSASAMGNSFSPPIPTSGSTYTSTAQRRVNVIRVSKTDQPESCPRGNDIIVGGEDEEIERIIPLRTNVIVIKTHSVWYLTDGDAAEEPTFIDDTVSIAGRDTAAKLNNTVFFLSDQGFVAATTNGVQLVGRPIESRVLAGLEALNAPDHTTLVGGSHEQRRLYICTMRDADAGETTCYMYSPIANHGKGAWSKRRLNAAAFCTLSNRLMYALNNSYGHVLRQRASLRDGAPWYRDYCEESSTFVIASIDATEKSATGTYAAGVNYDGYNSGPDVGWKFYSGTNQYVAIAATLNGDGTYTLALNTVTGLATGSVTLYRPVEWDIEWAPITADNPLETKQFGDVIAKCETSNVYAMDFSCTTEIDTKAVPYSDSWETAPPRDRVYVPNHKGQRATSSSNDFGATVGSPVPFNAVRLLVPTPRMQGSHLSPRISGGTAEGYIGIKSLVVKVERLGTVKGRA